MPCLDFGLQNCELISGVFLSCHIVVICSTATENQHTCHERQGDGQECGQSQQRWADDIYIYIYMIYMSWLPTFFFTSFCCGREQNRKHNSFKFPEPQFPPLPPPPGSCAECLAQRMMAAGRPSVLWGETFTDIYMIYMWYIWYPHIPSLLHLPPTLPIPPL